MENRNNKGQFTTGNKAGGRSPGSKNQITQNIRETFLCFLQNNLEGMQEDLDQLEPRGRFDVIFKMAKYILPTLKSIEFGNVLDSLTEEDFEKLIKRLKADIEYH